MATPHRGLYCTSKETEYCQNKKVSDAENVPGKYFRGFAPLGMLLREYCVIIIGNNGLPRVFKERQGCCFY